MFNKNKNIYDILSSETGEVLLTIDINEGGFVGKKGKLLKNRPAKAMTYINNAYWEMERGTSNFSPVISLLYATNGKPKARELVIADRLQSANIYIQVDGYSNENKLSFIENNFAQIVKFYNSRERDYYYLNDLLHDFHYHIAKSRYGFMKDMNEEQERLLRDIILNSLSDKLREKIMLKVAKMVIDQHLEIFRSSTLLYKYMDWCYELETVYYRKNTPFQQLYIELRNIYENKRNEILNKGLQIAANRVEQYASYEDDEYIAIVPRTTEEFFDEGEQQSNCVARLYMQRVARQDTSVVFIRRKSNPLKSYVTCELDIETGEIKQYLKRFNYQIEGIEELDFKKKYQQYVYQNIKLF